MLFAQLSDTHIKDGGRKAYQTVDTQGALETAVMRLGQLKGLKFVVVSGDLTDIPSAGGYQLFARIMRQLPCPWYVLPGNHDHRELLREGLAADQPQLPREGWLDYAIDAGPLRLLALDTLVQDEPYGDIRPQQAEWLDRQLTSDARPTVLFMHHPPCPVGIRGMDDIRCRNANRLVELIERHPHFRHIACGHVHRDISFLWHGCLVTLAPGVSHAVFLEFEGRELGFSLEPTYCRLFYYHDQQLVHHLQPLQDYGWHPFLNEQGQLID